MPEQAFDLAAWLRRLGLERYAPAFQAAEVTRDLLPELTDADLRELGLPLGPRKAVLKAIRGMAHAARAGDGRPAVPAEAERRQLTVLFVDLVGSTALSRRLDPEEMREVLKAYHDVVGREVGRFEGFVAKLMGDGLLAYFGWPAAHEDEAERAVRAGLAAVRAVAALEAPDGTRLEARAGIATGTVVVGELIGAGEASERVAVGETPNLAARLQAAVGPGQVVIADATHRLLGGLFECADAGAIAVKGLAEPVRAWLVERERPAESRFEARHGGGLTPFVGRERELGLLLDRWARAKAGEGQVVLLVGEPGIGKSRLVQALRDRLRDEPHARLRYQCSPQHTSSALRPVLDHLEHAAGLAHEDPPAAKLEKLEALLGRAAAPLMADLLAIPVEGSKSPPELSAQEQKARLFEAMLARLDRLAAERPVLMVLEDAHWIDPTTRELFEAVVQRLPRLPALLVVTLRPERGPPWADAAHATVVTLRRLGPRQAQAMLAELTGGKGLPAEVAAQIVERTDGVPLFVEELTKTVLEAGLLEEAGGRLELSDPLPPLAIPSTLQDSLMARLDRLAPVKEVAQLAACLGREFKHRLLAAVSLMPEAELAAALDRLMAAELLFRHGVPPEASYVFKHALVRDAAYATLLKSRRRQHHARIAKVLAARFPETVEAQPELLAHHLAEAGLTEPAIEQWAAAGRRAVARSAMAEAAAQLTQGLALLRHLPPGPGRNARELELQLTLATALNATRGHGTAPARRAYERAVELAKELGDMGRLLPAMDGLVTCRFSRAELAAADELAEEFVRLAEAAGEVGAQLVAWNDVGTIRLARGDLPGARRCLERALALHDPAAHGGLRFAYSFDPRVIAQGYLAWTLLTQGFPAQALACSRRSVAEARAASHPMTLAFALARATAVLQLCRDLPGVEAVAAELAGLAAARGLGTYKVVGSFYRGWAQVQRGCGEEGLACLGAALAELRAAGDEDWFPHTLALVAEAHLRAGRAREGLQHLAEALTRAERNDERWFAAEALRLKGELRLALGDAGAAEACFRQAAEVARAQGARMWELRAAMSLARLWRRQGRSAEARRLLAPVHGAFTEGLDLPDLKEAEALLRADGGRHAG